MTVGQADALEAAMIQEFRLSETVGKWKGHDVRIVRGFEAILCGDTITQWLFFLYGGPGPTEREQDQG
jgi:hypothetical protein